MVRVNKIGQYIIVSMIVALLFFVATSVPAHAATHETLQANVHAVTQTDLRSMRPAGDPQPNCSGRNQLYYLGWFTYANYIYLYSRSFYFGSSLATYQYYDFVLTYIGGGTNEGVVSVEC